MHGHGHKHRLLLGTKGSIMTPLGIDFSSMASLAQAAECSPVRSDMTLKGINDNVDLACAGLPDAAPSSILAGPLASICLQKLHKQQHILRSYRCPATAQSSLSSKRAQPVLHCVAIDQSEQASRGQSHPWEQQARAKQSRAGQGKAEQGRAGQGRAD